MIVVYDRCASRFAFDELRSSNNVVRSCNCQVGLGLFVCSFTLRLDSYNFVDSTMFGDVAGSRESRLQTHFLGALIINDRHAIWTNKD